MLSFLQHHIWLLTTSDKTERLITAAREFEKQQGGTIVQLWSIKVCRLGFVASSRWCVSKVLHADNTLRKQPFPPTDWHWCAEESWVSAAVLKICQAKLKQPISSKSVTAQYLSYLSVADDLQNWRHRYFQATHTVTKSLKSSIGNSPKFSPFLGSTPYLFYLPAWSPSVADRPHTFFLLAAQRYFQASCWRNVAKSSPPTD